MADWHQFFQSVLLGLLTFSYLLAKLFSVILSFRDENLRITRDDSSEPEAQEKAADFWDENEPLIPGDGVTGNESVVTSDHSDSDDDWEGVESTELDKIFSVATAFIAATAADRAAVKASNDVQLQLYSLYKIAIEGPCSAPQPSALKMTARKHGRNWVLCLVKKQWRSTLTLFRSYIPLGLLALPIIRREMKVPAIHLWEVPGACF
ncbi:acyl-CoA-binding domain-containing protein 1-like isoform X2 [Salvia splendens]|uniref:acyl-CoA-binding domain-containing protein 1-like isoform X2 n=1 Tax=Salvia splendens TaxID=180675 RepID=UPI001C25EAF2|nr:acyl-CoA-binding domain-containing protein 1-like isoform X2 [Salvia splendens]